MGRGSPKEWLICAQDRPILLQLTPIFCPPLFRLVMDKLVGLGHFHESHPRVGQPDRDVYEEKYGNRISGITGQPQRSKALEECISEVRWVGPNPARAHPLYDATDPPLPSPLPHHIIGVMCHRGAPRPVCRGRGEITVLDV